MKGGENMSELWQFMTVRELRGCKEVIVSMDEDQEQEWNDAYFDCPEYAEYCREWC